MDINTATCNFPAFIEICSDMRLPTLLPEVAWRPMCFGVPMGILERLLAKIAE